jgi:TfoX/Sxy family transcriptional regulator of competence genes
MPYDEKLAARIETILKEEKKLTSKKMFGGICYLINGNMCCGVEKTRVMVRIGAENYESALKEKSVRPMDFTGRPLKGFLYLTAQSSDDPSTLKKWILRAAAHARELPPKKSAKK